tara:strand:+ start:84 stop:875 length:792 start_codon:yes stop_codon:yes gene_type:complete
VRKKNNFKNTEKKKSESNYNSNKKYFTKSSIRLNKFIAKAGICSRREADQLISAGVITVNGISITEMGYRVNPNDDIRFNGQRLKSDRLRYVLLNKPKNYSGRTHSNTSTQTVIQLTKRACKETILPIDRLNKLDTGLLLLTNDQDLTKKLNNPNKKIKTIFHVILNKPLEKNNLENIKKGIVINNKKTKIHAISYINGKKKNEIGIENYKISVKIIRTLFEKTGYSVIKIDRVSLAGLTKKDLPRKHFRHLSQEEINILNRI